jgi:uncharacterized protein (DUF305 family)
MAIQTRIVLFACLVAGPACFAQTDAARIVQPGAPGHDGMILTPETARIKPIPLQPADIAFMQGMIHHHQQAVEMTAMMPTHTKNKALLKLGQRISISQTDEIRMMRNWLTDRGLAVPVPHDMSHMDHAAPGTMDMGAMAPMPGMLTAQQMKDLAASRGDRFDYLFLTGMIQHHKGALTMVADLYAFPATAQDNVLYDFVTDVDNTQGAEIKIMQGMVDGMKTKGTK